MLTCQRRARSCPQPSEPPLALAAAAGSGLQPWEPFALAATYNSTGEDLCHPSSSRDKRRSRCFLIPCEQRGRPGGTQDIFPNISGLIFKKEVRTRSASRLHGEFCGGHHGTAAQQRGCACCSSSLVHRDLIAIHRIQAIRP